MKKQKQFWNDHRNPITMWPIVQKKDYPEHEHGIKPLHISHNNNRLVKEDL